MHNCVVYTRKYEKNALTGILRISMLVFFDNMY